MLYFRNQILDWDILFWSHACMLEQNLVLQYQPTRKVSLLVIMKGNPYWKQTENTVHMNMCVRFCLRVISQCRAINMWAFLAWPYAEDSAKKNPFIHFSNLWHGQARPGTEPLTSCTHYNVMFVWRMVHVWYEVFTCQSTKDAWTQEVNL